MSGEPPDSAKRLHIAFYAPSWPPAGAANGIVTYVRAMRDELVRQGHRVSIMTLVGSFDWDRPDVCRPLALGLPGTAWAKLLGRWDLATQDTARSAYRVRKLFEALHRRHPIDIIEMEESFGWFAEAAKIGVPVVARLHGPIFRAPTFEIARRRLPGLERREQRERKALASARAITAPSRVVLEETRTRYGLGCAKTEVIINSLPPAVRSETWMPANAEPHTILWVGQFSTSKRPDTMLKAFEIVLDQFPNARLTMVGPDYGLRQGDRSLKYAEYAAKYLSPDVAARVSFTGRLEQERIEELRLRSAVAVVTSKAETFCYVLAEAMAMGMPVVATPWEGIEDLIGSDGAAVLSRDFTPETVAAAIVELLTDKATAYRVGSSGRKVADQKLSAQNVVERTLAFYRSVLR